MSFLNRSEEGLLPSWPVAVPISTKFAFATVIPTILSRKQLLSTFAPILPIQITLLAVVTLPPALWPKAMLGARSVVSDYEHEKEQE
jgi:hypothetical protein